jgi:hypothetical protein
LFNEKIAKKVFGILNEVWKERQGIFKGIVLPQDQWPITQSDPKTIANWFFYAALPMRGGIISEAPFTWFWEAQKIYPEMFDPSEIANNWSVEKITQVMTEIGQKMFNPKTVSKWDAEKFGYKMREHVNSWYHNSHVLSEKFDGDARNIFLGVKDFEAAFARIDYKRNNGQGIVGMRRKIFSLFTIWLQEKGLIPFFKTPIPVDFHALRIIFATNIIKHEAMLKPFQGKEEKHPEQLEKKLGRRVYENLIDEITMWSQKFIAANKFSHLNINPALWCLSRILCARHFQNISRDKGMSFVDSEELKNNPQLWPKNYKNPCFFCPIEKFCQWSIPASPYYDWGLLVVLGKRVPYEQNQLFFPGIDWKMKMEFLSARKNNNK